MRSYYAQRDERKRLFSITNHLQPSTKASEGHDEDISAEEIIATGLATKEEWDTLSKYTLALFARGKEIASKRGLILVDTKYEFGKLGDQIVLMDEIHTPILPAIFMQMVLKKDRKKENVKNS
jgi:phosphoribosylaminoimidazole-succinocarboxamide synthase